MHCGKNDYHFIYHSLTLVIFSLGSLCEAEKENVFQCFTLN